MPRRRWDDPWQRYPASVPLPAEGGVATSKQRGAMAGTWWSQRFVDVLESYGLGTRMQRGRRYARTGQVLSLEVRAAVVAAQVQGSRRTPYLVTISLPEPTPEQWSGIEVAMAAKIGFVARLLAGEVSPEMEEIFDAAQVPLFPRTWTQLRADCTCPDWENPCKHIAAVLYVLADQLDADPWLLLQWRGRTREELLGRLRPGAVGNPSQSFADSEEVAPWWPYPPGSLPPLDEPATSRTRLVDPDRPDAVLDQLDEPAVEDRDVPFRDLVAPAYDALASAADEPRDEDAAFGT